MITVYLKDHMGSLKASLLTPDNQDLLQEALWIDLVSPVKGEEALLEGALKLDIPTRDEMQEIELSSRLYAEGKTLFMTTMMLAQVESPEPQYDAVTFVLAENKLITIRYIEPQAFRLFVAKLPKLEIKDAIRVLLGLLDATVERLADILEGVGRHLEKYSKMIFRPEQMRETDIKLDSQALLQELGINADINTKVRESLIAFNRLIIFFDESAPIALDKSAHTHLITLSKDMSALSDHANFLSAKVNFLLDASLGLVTIEQNKIIKLFSVAAAILIPPMLIASIYGMNFHNMPELSWRWGYPLAIVMMGLSAWLPYRYIKYRKWLL